MKGRNTLGEAMSIELVEGSFDALIFDCDGTLVDTAPAHFRALETAFAAYGMPFGAEFYFARTGLSPGGLLDAYEAEYRALPVKREELLGEYSVAYAEGLDRMREIPVVAELARRWRGRVPMAVASNGHRANVEGSLRSTELLGLFDTVVAVEDVRRGKPAPDLYLEAARRLGVGPARCTVLEDTDEGIEAGRAAGMTVVDIRESWTPGWRTEG